MTLTDVLAPLAGGVLIGLASLLLYLALGRIAGVSGIAYAGIWGAPGERTWRWVFLAGLVAGGWFAALGVGMLSAPALTGNGVALALASGLIVGFGTRMGGGCTSGHGVCGLARLSSRSLVAVAVFMALGMLTATLLRPLLA
ncbi:MAG: YeeE/YedE family protein [Gammaproteobacteria bacterium]